MLNLWGKQRSDDCEGHNRRDFLKVGALGHDRPGPGRPAARAGPRGQHGHSPAKDTSVVWLWLGGGPTHVETFDPKMAAPAEFRSVIGAVETSVARRPARRLVPEDGQRGRQDGLRPLVRPQQLRPRRRHALRHDRLRHPPADDGMPPIKPVVRLDRRPRPRRQQSRDRHADLRAAVAASTATARTGSARPTPRSMSAARRATT